MEVDLVTSNSIYVAMKRGSAAEHQSKEDYMASQGDGDDEQEVTQTEVGLWNDSLSSFFSSD